MSKQIYTILVALLITATVWAQAPEKMSYQAVIRNSSDQLVTNQNIGIQITILQGLATGTVVYQETQTPTTNANGLLAVEFGGQTGFDTINWANGTYFIKTQIDPTGGTDYTITGTSQLLSVPYAMHAKTAESITGAITETDPVFNASAAGGITATDTTNWNRKLDSEIDGSVTNEIQTILRTGLIVTLSNGGGSFQDSVNAYTAGEGIDIDNNVLSIGKPTFYLGQDTLGGIVFYIYVDSIGIQHGLIINKNSQTSQKYWQQTSQTNTGANRTWDGAYNTPLMTNSGAATYVNELTDGDFNDWYLPSIDELSLLWHNRFHINKAMYNAGASFIFLMGTHWSSTESNNFYAYYFDLTTGSAVYELKEKQHYIRAIRAF